MLARLGPIAYALLVIYLCWDCYRYKREPFWFLVILVPVLGPFFYLYRFKF